MHRRRLPAPIPTLYLAVALLAACGPSGNGGAPAGTDTSGPAPAVAPAQSYEVRGEVTAVPVAGEPASDLYIRHEAVDDFTDIDGDVVGMDAMAMPFPLADGVSAAELAPGDKVSFTLEVDWDGDPPYRIVRLEKLPGETELEFRAARPSSAKAPETTTTH